MGAITFTARNLVGATLLTAVAMLGGVQAGEASPIPSSIKIVGMSCDRPLQVLYSRSGPDIPYGIHPYDDHWIHVGATSAGNVWTLNWSLSDEVALCPGGWTRLGYGNFVPITAAPGSTTDSVRATGPVKIKVNARFAKPITMRDDIDPRRLKSLVAGWARRGCALQNSKPAVAEMLNDLAVRAGAHECKPPARVRPTALQLLRHLTAHFNALGPFLGGSSYLAGAPVIGQAGREYYRLLSQFTSF